MATVAGVSSLGGYALNPRGNIWLNDDSTLGHKLLMKMGWSKGKGLGKNENGIRENIKVKFKSSKSGVGFKDKSFFKVQNTDYDSLLKSISDNCVQHEGAAKTTIAKQEGLEKRSQSFRNRLHYRKFVTGKDLSKYSEKDMKSIFILNKIPEEDEKAAEGDITPAGKDCETGEKSMDTCVSHLSVSDYFAHKLKEKKGMMSQLSGRNSHPQQTNLNCENVEKENSSLLNTHTISDNKRKIKDNREDAISVNRGIVQQMEPKSNVSSKKKKRLKDLSCSNSISELDSPVCKKKRKKSEISEDLSTDYTEENNVSNNNTMSEIFELDSSVPKKKRKKSEIWEDLCASANLVKENNVSNNNTMPEIFELDSSVPKKKRKKSEISEDACVSANGVEENNILCKKYAKYSEGNSVAVTNVEKTDVERKQKKSKKHKLKHFRTLKSCLKSKRGKYCVKKVSFNENVSYRMIKPILKSSVDEQDCIAIHAEEEETEVCREEAIESIVDKQATNDEANEVLEEEEKDGCSLSNLPNRKSDYFNGWIESQRHAMKMEMYKNMLKSLKKHEVLRTANMLSIRGYGNWGF